MAYLVEEESRPTALDEYSKLFGRKVQRVSANSYAEAVAMSQNLKRRVTG